MQLEISIDECQKLALIRISGPLVPEEIARHAAEFVERPDFVPGMPAIFDLRGLDFGSLRSTESQAVGEMNRRLAVRRGSARVAMVVDSDLGFGASRMHEVLGRSPNLHFMVFRDMQEARDWVLGPSTPERRG